MNLNDYFTKGRWGWFGPHEKGGKYHEVPAHHNAGKYVETYLEATGIGEQPKTPLFRSLS